MYWLVWLVLVGGGLANAQTILKAPREIPVYQSTMDDPRVIFYLRKGEPVSVAPARHPEYYEIRVNRNGKARAGYIQKLEVEEFEQKVNVYDVGGTKSWALALGGQYTSLTQGSKSFDTQEPVHYTTTQFKSSASSIFVSVQMDYNDFWRLTLAQKKTHYTSTARDNVSTRVQNINLEQTFVSVLLQKAWCPFQWKLWYFGLGLEAAKATAVSLKLDAVEVPTTSDNMPLYLGGQLFVGAHVLLAKTFSLFTEFRYEQIVNQSPPISGLEISLGFLYWL
jgi:hypothetical protein